MKRFFQITLGIIGVLLLLLLIIPSLFKGKIEEKVKEVINEQVNATVSFDRFSLSMFRHFPDLGMGLSGLTIVNKAPFEGDTLLTIPTFSASIDLWSAITGKGIQVNSVLLDEPRVWLAVNKDSIANWDIMPVDTLVVEEDTSEVSDFNVQLDRVDIKNAFLTYTDHSMNFSTRLDGLDATMKGDLSQTDTRLVLDASVGAFNLDYEEVRYIKDAVLSLDAIVGADLDKMIFTFQENELMFNQLPLFFEGSVGMPEEGYELDLRLAAKDTDFKTLLSLVPEAYMKDLQTLKTTGSIKFEAVAKGLYLDTDHLPAFNLVLQATNGSIQYPDLPESINDIQIDMEVDNPGGSMDRTLTNIKRFHFTLGGNPFDASLRVSTPVSNAAFNGSMKGTIDLTSLADAVPMDSMELSGTITTNMTLKGNYEMVEKELYEQIEANGDVTLKDFVFKSPDLPMGATISTANLQLTPRYMELNSFASKLGNSDFSLKGRLENYLSYALKDGVLKGRLDHHSQLIDTNELMALANDTTQAEDSTSMGLIIVPKTLDFTLNSRISRLEYDKLLMNNINGTIRIVDGRVVLDGLKSDMLNGKMVVSGEYNTADTLKPFVNFDMALESIDIHQAANSFSMVDSLMPIAKKAVGTVSTNVKFNTLMGNDLTPILSSLSGGGLLKSQGVEISGAKVQNALATMLNNDKYKTASASDLKINFALENGNVVVQPFNANLFGKQLTIGGMQGLDKSMNYVITMPVTRGELSDVAGLLGSSLPTSGDDFMVDILIQGTVSDPELKINLDKVKDQVKDDLKKEAEKAVDKLLDDPDVKKKVDEVKEKLKGLFK